MRSPGGSDATGSGADDECVGTGAGGGSAAQFVGLGDGSTEGGPDDRDGLSRLLASVEGFEDLLCFSTDYPHPTDDEPEFVMRQLPREWLTKVFCTNACDVYGWTPPPIAVPKKPLAAATG